MRIVDNVELIAPPASAAVAGQIPYWVAVLTPEERSLGSRRTDPRIDTVDSSVVTHLHNTWAASEPPTQDTLLAALAVTVGSWQGNRCRASSSGVLIDIESPADVDRTLDSPLDSEDGVDTALFPVRLPSAGTVSELAREVRRRIDATPRAGIDFGTAKYALRMPALVKRSGAQIAFRFGPRRLAPDDQQALQHSLSMHCTVATLDGAVTVETELRWNCRIFTRADVDEFESLWRARLAELGEPALVPL